MDTIEMLNRLKSMDLKLFFVTTIYINIIIAPIKNLLKDTITPDISVVFVTIFPKYELRLKDKADNKSMIKPIWIPPDFDLFKLFYYSLS